MAKIHLVPVETELFSEIYDRYRDKVVLKDVEQELSFLNRRFIFRKLEQDEIMVEVAFNQIKNLRDSNNKVVTSALSTGLQQNSWESLRTLLPQLKIEVSDSEFPVLTRRLSEQLMSKPMGGTVIKKRKTSLKKQVDK